MEELEDSYTGIWILMGFLILVLIFVSAYTGFNPFRDCSQINSSILKDCWFQ